MCWEGSRASLPASPTLVGLLRLTSISEDGTVVCVLLAVSRFKSLLGDRVLGHELLSNLLFWLPALKLTELAGQ